MDNYTEFTQPLDEVETSSNTFRDEHEYWAEKLSEVTGFPVNIDNKQCTVSRNESMFKKIINKLKKKK